MSLYATYGDKLLYKYRYNTSRGEDERHHALGKHHRTTASAIYKWIWLKSTRGHASGLWERIECGAARTLILCGRLRRLGV
jgi:hypothetical protein